MRPGRWWLVIGTLAMLGAYWCALAFVERLELAADRAPYAIHVLGGAGGGALLAACVPVRPWRAPVAAGIACVASMSLLFALLVRGRRAELGTAKIVLLSGLVLLGSWVIVTQAVIGWTGRRDTALAMPLLTAATFAAGMLVQIVVPRRCAIACACGATAIIVFRLGRGSWSLGLLARATLAAAMFALLVYLGARVAWRWIGSRRPAPPDVPAAQLR